MKRDNLSTSLKIVNLNTDSKLKTKWVQLNLNDEDAMRWLEQDSGLKMAAIMALSANETRPRSFKENNGLLIILRGVNLNPGHDPEDMVSVRVWLEEHRVISINKRGLVSIQEINNEIEQGDGPSSAGNFLVELLSKLAVRIGDFVEEMDAEIELLEDSIEQISPSQFRSLIGDVRKQVAMVRRYMAPQRDALDRLNHLGENIFSELERIQLREESDRISRYLEDLDLIRERAVVLQELFLSQLAQQQNNRVFVLSIITAVFLPLGFVTGLLGINVGGMPGANSPYGFWMVFGLLCIIAMILFFLFRRLKWL